MLDSQSISCSSLLANTDENFSQPHLPGLTLTPLIEDESNCDMTPK
jgi:hypothetical protein